MTSFPLDHAHIKSPKTPAGQSVRSFVQRVLQHPYAPIFAILLLAILVGARIVDAYGQSWDEYANYANGEKALLAYTNGTFLQDQNEPYFHGTFYFMIFSMTSRFFSDVFSHWSNVDGRHFTNYLAFLMATLGFYAIALRLMDRRWAAATTIIFFTQPIYFGHAFINQKDIPFMAFFMASLTLGLHASDIWHQTLAPDPEKRTGLRNRLAEIAASLRWEWGRAGRGRQVGLLVFLVLGVLATLDLFLQGLIYPTLRELLVQAYHQESIQVINAVFSFFAKKAADFPIEGYLEKFRIAYWWMRVPGAAVALLPAFVLAARWLPETYSNHVRQDIVRYGTWCLAGILLGLTTSIRVFGPFAGLLVSFYALQKDRRRALPALLFYWVIAVIINYLSWPALWGNPIDRIRQRLLIASDFSPNFLLFEGRYILSDQLPRHFVPKLIGLQFTEPVLLFFVVGLATISIAALNRRTDRTLFVLILLWLFVPIGTQIFHRTTIYDNFRQLLFALPPLVLLSGYGLMRVLKSLRLGWSWVVVVPLMILPGITHIIKYYPYEYIYYNSLAGGPSGAVGSYELDYWCTSYREAIEYVNANASRGATILVLGPDEAAREFAREDLNIVAEDASILVLGPDTLVREYAREDLVMDGETGEGIQPEYFVSCTRAVRGVPFYPDMEVVHQVRRDQAILTVIKAAP